MEKISIKDDFFELGGHSLIAIKVMVEIQTRTGKRLPLASLFESPTVEKLAKLLNPDDEYPSKKWNALVPIQTKGSKTPLYLIHGGGLNILVFKNMSKYLSEDQPVYALQALGLNGETELLYSIEDIAKKYNSEILQLNPDGPFAIAGYSLGGKIAYEMARQLLAMGKEIKMLGIFDTYNGSNSRGIKRFTEKVIRQFFKIPFIIKLLINNPKRTITYQLFLAKNKLNRSLKHEVSQEEVFVGDKEILRSYETAYKNYFITPAAVGIDLFRVKERIYYLDDPVYLGWKNLSKNAVTIHEIPGDHKTFLFSPNDKELAKLLQKALDDKEQAILKKVHSDA